MNQNCESNPRRCVDCVKFGAGSKCLYSRWCGWEEPNPETRGRGCFVGHGLFRGTCQEPEALRACDQEPDRSCDA